MTPCLRPPPGTLPPEGVGGFAARLIGIRRCDRGCTALYASIFPGVVIRQHLLWRYSGDLDLRTSICAYVKISAAARLSALNCAVNPKAPIWPTAVASPAKNTSLLSTGWERSFAEPQVRPPAHSCKRRA